MRTFIVVLSFLSFSMAAHAAESDCPMLDRLALQMKVVSENIENAGTSMTQDGGPYRRKSVYCETEGCEITEHADFRDVYLPGHPDADASGYVRMPKIDVMAEMAMLVGLQHTYDQVAVTCRR